jgi:hypothetical protein
VLFRAVLADKAVALIDALAANGNCRFAAAFASYIRRIVSSHDLRCFSLCQALPGGYHLLGVEGLACDLKAAEMDTAFQPGLAQEFILIRQGGIGGNLDMHPLEICLAISIPLMHLVDNQESKTLCSKQKWNS